jgi:L-gulonolactone oxidase
MLNSATWLLGIFMMLSCCDAAKMEVSEAYSHNDSSRTLYSGDNYLKCTVDQQVTVTSTREISDLIKQYSTDSHSVRIRATRRGFHSSMGFVCAGKRGSSYAEYHKANLDSDPRTSVTVLLHLMNNVVS